MKKHKRQFKLFNLVFLLILNFSVGCENNLSMDNHSSIPNDKIKEIEGTWCLSPEDEGNIFLLWVMEENDWPTFEFKNKEVFVKLGDELIEKGKIVSKEDEWTLIDEKSDLKGKIIKHSTADGKDELEILFKEENRSVYLIRCGE